MLKKIRQQNLCGDISDDGCPDDHGEVENAVEFREIGEVGRSAGLLAQRRQLSLWPMRNDHQTLRPRIPSACCLPTTDL